MPKISVVPTHEVMKIAEDQGMLPERYIGGLEKMLMPYELRYKDKNGKFLHDLKITRDDGTAFSIHEVESESEKLPKFVISDYGKKGVKRFYAYTSDIDLIRLQNDKKYLYAFSEELCSRKRIEEKRQISLKNDNKEFVYLGGLKYDSASNRYMKITKKYEDVEKELGITQKKQLAQAEKKQKENQQKEEKNALIGNIAGHLVGLSVDELKNISKQLGI